MSLYSVNSRKPAVIRIGAVSYLNTKPLVATLERRLAPGSQLCLDLPSRLATQLSNRSLDVGLIPAIEFFRGAKPSDPSEAFPEPYRIISNACIACRGIVRSVRLFFRVPPNRVGTIAIDEGSKTSIALACILLHERFGIRPELVPLPIAADPNDTDSDAVLVIGDRAMHPHRFQNFLENWDLGSEWFRETGLPFVFAMWVGRESIASLPLASQLETARDEGVQMIHELSEKYAARYELTTAECVEYLSSNLRFTMNDDEVLGLRTFYRMAVDLELIPRSPVPNWPIVSLCTSPQLTSI